MFDREEAEMEYMSEQEGFEMCPGCGKRMLADAEVTEGRLQQCFNVACGQRILTRPGSELSLVLEAVYRDTHAELLRERDGSRTDAFRYLAEERGIQPRVIAHSMVGVIPAGYDVAKHLTAHLLKAQEEVNAESRRRRGPGRPPQTAGWSADERLATLQKASGELEAFFNNQGGALLFFYTGPDHRITAVRRQHIGAGQAWFTAGERRGVFYHGLSAAQSSKEPVCPWPLIVVEDEVSVMALQSMLARRAAEVGVLPEAGYVPCAAVSDAPDAGTVHELCRTPIVGHKVQYLAEVLRQKMNVRGFTIPEPHRDLASLLFSVPQPRAAYKHVQKLLDSAALYPRPFDKVRQEVDDIRRMDRKKFEVDRAASDYVVRDLCERGRLFFDGRLPYLLLLEHKQVIPIDADDDAFRLLADKYGVRYSDGLFKQLLSATYLKAQEQGVRTTVYSFSHYDVDRGVLYVYNLGRSVYRISATKVQVVDNGTDDVLFVRNQKWTPFTAGKRKGNRNVLADLLIGNVRFNDGSLTNDERRALFTIYVLALFFPELFPTKIILTLVGPKGSGKTSVLKRLGTLLYGRAFGVSDITNDSKDFDAAITKELFVVVDNADRPIPWLEDKLAMVATGGSLKRRQLFTTNLLVEFPITSFLGITSRTPHFRREDVADRLLPMRVDRLTAFVPEASLEQRVLRDRDAVMTEILGQLQQVVGALRVAVHQHVPTRFRMADFADFAIKVGPALGFGDMETVLNKVADEQTAFAVEDDSLLEVLDAWLARPEGDRPALSTGKLYVALRTVAEEMKLPFEFKNALALGLRLAELESTLETLYGACRREGRANTRVWTFQHPRHGGSQAVPVLVDPSEADVAA